MIVYYVLLYIILADWHDCPRNGSYVGVCKPCVFLEQCTQNPLSSCDAASHLCIHDHDSNNPCPNAEGSGCDPNDCSEGDADYPDGCSCTNHNFPNNWVDCTDTTTTTLPPSKSPTISDCPDGNFLSKCERCVWDAQCRTNEICDHEKKLCVDGSTTCSEPNAECDDGCNQNQEGYPHSCACKNQLFPDVWVDCSKAKTSKLPTPNPSVSPSYSPSSNISTTSTLSPTISTTNSANSESEGPFDLSTLDYILLGALMIFILGCCATMWCFRKTIIARFAYSGSGEDKREPFLSLNSDGSNTHMINSPGSAMRSDTPTRSFLKRMVRSLEGYESESPAVDDLK